MSKDVNIYAPIGGKDLLKLTQMRLRINRSSLAAPPTSGVGGVLSPAAVAGAQSSASPVSKLATVRRILRTATRVTGTGVLRGG